MKKVIGGISFVLSVLSFCLTYNFIKNYILYGFWDNIIFIFILNNFLIIPGILTFKKKYKDSNGLLIVNLIIITLLVFYYYNWYLFASE